MMQEHGGNIYLYENMLDFSANLNPLGLPPRVREAVIAGAALWECYPDPDCTALTRRLAEHEHISPAQIVCGNGAADLIYRLVHALRPRRAVLCAPTFGEYAAALREIGCTIREHVLYEHADFALDESLLPLLTPETDVLFLCTPNNPTGRRTAPALLRKIAQHCESCGILLVCDECFLDFTEDAESYSLRRLWHEHAVILKAFTKIFAMPGLRLGYAVCGSPETAERIRRSGQFWSVSAPAQAAGLAALGEADYIRRTVLYIAQERDFLRKALTASGLHVFPSDANFLLLKGAPGLDDRMRQEGILIRNCADYSGLGEGFFRIAVRTHEENLRLTDAFEHVL